MKKTRVALCISTLAFAAALAAGCATTETHDLTLVPEQEPTCTEAGHGQYYSCSDCGKYFSDAQGTTEISLDDIAIPALGHDLHFVEAKESTCTQEGNIAYYDCSRCDVNFADEAGTQELTESPFLGKADHDMEIVQRLEPTYDADGHIAYYECSRCHNKYADVYGDQQYTDDDVLLPKYENIGTVTLTFTAYQNGETTTPSFSEEQITLTSRNVEGKTLTGVANSASASIQNAYNDDYTIVVGDYTGEVSFTEGTTAYSVELQYQYATDTSVGETSSVDLTYMNDADHTIIMNETRNNTGVSSWAKATLTLPEAVAESTNVAVGFTIRWLSGTNTTNLNGYARFGVQMAGDDGIFAAVMGPNDGAGYPLELSVIRDPDHKLGIFDTDGLKADTNEWRRYSGDVYTDVSNAVKGPDGLPVIVVRMGGSIRMYFCLNDEWMLLGGPVACDAEAETAISLLVGGHEWEFSDITFETVTLNEQKDPTDTEAGHIAHYAFNGMLFNAEGTVLSEEDILLYPTGMHESVTLTIQGRKNAGNQTSLSGTITLSNTDHTYEGTVKSGKVTLENIYQGVYNVTLVADNGDIYDGTATIGADTEYTLSGTSDPNRRMEYRFVTFTSNIESVGGSYTTDTSAMNNTHHIVVINNSGPGAQTNYYTKATYTISDELAASKYAVMDFWLKYTGSSFSATSRFGVMLADGKGITVAVFPNTSSGSRLQVSYFYENGENDIFGNSGSSAVYRQEYYSAVYNALLNSITGNNNSQGGRLHLQAVRADTNIYLYAELGGVWYLLGQTTCGTDDATQISFLALNGSWEVHDISFGAMTSVAAAEATEEAAGCLAHYTWRVPTPDFPDDYVNADVVYYFNADGTRTTLEALTLANSAVLDSVTLTISGKKDGATAALSGSLSGAFGALTVTGNVENGTVTLTNIRAGTYTLTLGDYDGTVTIEEGTTEYTVTMEYRYAVDTSRGSTAVVDLSGMNDKSHTIRLQETTTSPASVGVTGKAYWAEAMLNLSDEQAASTSVTVEFTVKVTGTTSFNAHSRFGMKIAGGIGFYVAPNVHTDVRLQTGTIDPNAYDGLFSNGWDSAHNSYTDAVTPLLQGEGLQVRIVREGTNLSMYFYLNSEWVLMGTATCSASAQTDIRFCASGHGSNVWEFSDITVTDNTPQA